MTVTTHSPETNRFISSKVINTSKAKARNVSKAPLTIYDACVLKAVMTKEEIFIIVLTILKKKKSPASASLNIQH